jgi:NAD+ diphosphatase
MFAAGVVKSSPCSIAASRIVRACHIAQWRHDSVFCGTCGAKNDFIPSPPHCVCPMCGRLEFPRICPAVITAITNNENKILLAHNKKFRAGVYSHIAGFNEAGESLEQTVEREIFEEINIKVKDIVYVKSQPWPFPNSLMLGFKARYSSGVIKPDGDEIEDAKWFTKDSLPDLPAEGSLSRFLINSWLSGAL